MDDRFERVIDAVMLVDEKLERFRTETKERFDVVEQRLDVIESHR
ncbi:MAG TPA: hypothetical protein VI391_02415 [Thermoanaerobaculia bacterium]